MKAGYLAPEGTNVYKVTKDYAPDAELIGYSSFQEIMLALSKKEIEIGTIAAKNINTQAIKGLYHLLIRYGKDIQIIDAKILKINHVLAALKNVNKIEVVYSHTEALEQCNEPINEKYPGVRTISTSSTGEAMEIVSKLKNAAAIGTEKSAKRSGLEIIARDLVPNNQTMFYIMGSKLPKPKGKQITPCVLYPERNEIGTLHSMLKPIKDNGINLTYDIHSIRVGRGKYIFYIEMEEHCLSGKVKKAVEGIEKKGNILILGSHPDLRFS